MLSLFSNKSKDQHHLAEIEKLQKRVQQLEQSNEMLVSALKKTQDVLATVSKSQSEFLVEFNRILLPVLKAAGEEFVMVGANEYYD